MKEAISIHWFRRDLRLQDNHALSKALQSGKPVLCIFIFDKLILDKLADKSDKRLTFIHTCLSSIHAHLKEMGSGLKTYYGEPLQVWQEIINEYKVKVGAEGHLLSPELSKRQHCKG